MDEKYLSLIDQSSVYDAAVKTPLMRAEKLSNTLNNEILIKREDLQPVFSFKIRGAYNKINALSQTEQNNGVIAASAGNHAQGVALSASILNIKATIVMPKTTPEIKVNAVKRYGAEVILHGESYSDASEKATSLVASSKASYIHPYDDVHVIAGQGTIGKEIIEQTLASQDTLPDMIFICIGGGGLAAGVATYVRQKYPSVKLIGVQPSDSNAMYQSFYSGAKVKLDNVGIFADGVAVKDVGDETFRLCHKYLDDILLVSTDEICAAIKDAYEDTRSILEPAGALAIAGAKKHIKEANIDNKTVIAITSGANMNFDRLRHVSERTEFAERREAIIAVTMPEQPGTMKAFCKLIGDRSITEFNYRYQNDEQATLYVGLSITGQHDLEKVLATFNNAGYPTLDLTDNELAKLHLRHMIGGKRQSDVKEVLYRFRFPEKPGALMHFLDQAGQNWNISLFHYRNHSADFGRVLCAFDVEDQKHQMFDAFIEKLDYFSINETDNAAYKLFLSPQ